jgi:phosphomannomutase / phosphoglucomutase
MKAPSNLTKRRRELEKLWLRYRVPAIGALALLLVLGGGKYLWQEFAAADKESHDAGLEAVISDYVSRIGNPIKAPTKMLDDALGELALADALSSGDAAQRQAAAGQLLNKIPAAKAARLIPNNTRKRSADGPLPISYGTLDMMRQALASERPPRAEIHLVGRSEEHIALMRRIGTVDDPAGVALVALPVDILKNAIAENSIQQGYVEIVQRVPGGRRVVLAQQGDTALKSGVAVIRRIRGTAWQLLFWMPAATSEDLQVVSGLIPIIGDAALLAVFGMLIALLALRKKRRAAERVMRGGAASAIAVEEDDAEGALASVNVGAKPAKVEESVTFEVEEQPAPKVESFEFPLGPPSTEGLDLDFFGGEDEVVDSPEPPPLPAVTSAAADSAIDATIFRAYDIRGVVGAGLDEQTMRTIGTAIGAEAYDRGQQTIVVARDGRTSAGAMRDALVEGLLGSGRDVVDIGQVPTPVLYFATHFLDTGSGVMVTGSHNPPNYNGLKIMLGGETLFGDAIQKLYQRALSGQFTDGIGQLQHMDLQADYVRRISEDIPVALGNAYKIVVDCGNGVAGDIAPKLFQALGHDVIELHCEIDGTFPNHAPDPTQPENLEDLIAAVRENEADIGFAFDGDGDRLGVVDGHGNIIWADRLMMLFANDILSRHQGASVVFDVKCSTLLRTVIERRGGTPIMAKTGHSYMKNKLHETGAMLAGELSGHIFFKERWYGFDDGLYSAARLLEILMNLKRKPVDVFARLPNGVNTPEIQMPLEEGQPFQVMDKVLENSALAGAEILTIDGLRAEFEDGWGLMRASNTTPMLIFRFEGHSQDALARIQTQFRELVIQADASLSPPF